MLHDAVVVCGDVGTGAELQGALFGHLQDNKSKGKFKIAAQTELCSLQDQR